MTDCMSSLVESESVSVSCGLETGWVFVIDLYLHWIGWIHLTQ